VVFVNKKRMAVIGVDGGHPKTLQKLMSAGKLPNFSELKEQGSFSELRTLNSSQSPIAWSSIITGKTPGNHGVHDFIVRDPKQLKIKLGMNDERVDNQGNVSYVNLRKAKAVWNYFDADKTTASLFVPLTFPAENLNGWLLGGMGIPDALGTQGVPSIYASNVKDSQSEVKKVSFSEENKAVIEITGFKGMKKKASLEIKDGRLIISIPSQDKIVLEEGQWSDWVYLLFEKAECVFRFKLISLKKEKFRLYLSPVGFSPRQNFIPMAHPTNLGEELLERIGNFKALSFESDVYGLKEELIDEKTWLEDMQYTLNKRVEVTKHLLDKKWNYFVVDFFAVDRAQHLFWHTIDKAHPYHDAGKGFEYVIDETYVKMDEKLGEMMKFFNEDDLVFVVSDHGFGSYAYNVEVNKILFEKGFLSLKKPNQSRSLNDIAWGRTKAYAVGFGAIYLNLAGREKEGIVSASELEAVRSEVIEELKKFNVDGQRIFKDLIPREGIYSGTYVDDMPDIIPIYNEGFRAGKESILGAVSFEKEIVHENRCKWSGDHIGPYDTNDNKGFIFSNSPLNLSDANVFDIGSTAADFFNGNLNNVDGKSLLR